MRRISDDILRIQVPSVTPTPRRPSRWIICRTCSVGPTWAWPTSSERRCNCAHWTTSSHEPRLPRAVSSTTACASDRPGNRPALRCRRQDRRYRRASTLTRPGSPYHPRSPAPQSPHASQGIRIAMSRRSRSLKATRCSGPWPVTTLSISTLSLCVAMLPALAVAQSSGWPGRRDVEGVIRPSRLPSGQSSYPQVLRTLRLQMCRQATVDGIRLSLYKLAVRSAHSAD